MNDLPPDFEDDDIDMGEPVTDKLNVLLEELSDEWDDEQGEVDLGEPVTDKLTALLDQLPDDWESDEADLDMGGPVTDRIHQLLAEMPKGGPPPRGFWTRVLSSLKAFFGLTGR